MVSASPVRLSMNSCGRIATASRKMEKDHRISDTELWVGVIRQEQVSHVSHTCPKCDQGRTTCS